jgi:hypothetical protein
VQEPIKNQIKSMTHTHDFTVGTPYDLKNGEQDIEWKCRTCQRNRATYRLFKFVERVVGLALLVVLFIAVIISLAGLDPVAVIFG